MSLSVIMVQRIESTVLIIDVICCISHLSTFSFSVFRFFFYYYYYSENNDCVKNEQCSRIVTQFNFN